MTQTKAALYVLVFGFVAFVLDGLMQRLNATAPTLQHGLIATAGAAGSCPIPPVRALAATWRVTLDQCSGTCVAGHLRVGDQLTFAQDVSGAENFSLAVAPGSGGRRPSRTEGTTLASDGVGNVKGPIVFEHNVLDGSPLQLHWLIVKIRSYDVDGLGQCKLRGRISVCGAEPARNATSCGPQQHMGDISVEL